MCVCVFLKGIGESYALEVAERLELPAPVSELMNAHTRTHARARTHTLTHTHNFV